MIKFLRALFVAALLFCGSFVSAQNKLTLDQGIDSLQKNAFDYPFEKVYLHLDKPFYAAGDTIWFKGYVLVGQDHKLTGISYVLNVDLINQQNSIIRSVRLPMVSGLTKGDFSLPDTLEEGNYRIRAYTNWMRNSGPEYFFDRSLRIVNAVRNKVFTESDYTYTTEGGKTVTNAVIRYTNQQGVPYIGKEIHFNVNVDGKQLLKDVANTDSQGKLHIKFASPTPGSGEIHTVIVVDSKTAIAKDVVIKAALQKYDTQFFPEGGNLIAGVTSKVAFKSIGTDGLGADINGTVTDDQNNTVAQISNSHFGMGYFSMTPVAGKTYTAHLTYPNGTSATIALPAPAPAGFAMTIENADSIKNVLVQITGAAGNTLSGSLTLLAQAGGKVYFEGRSKPGANTFATAIPKTRFPSGIIQFTLFADNGEPLCERLIFIKGNGLLNLSLSTDKPVYTTRQIVKLNLSARDNGNKPAEGNFSVAVIDASVIPVDEDRESTILSSVLLSSDLKGYIEQPNYYFAHKNAKAADNLDVLLLTQGYHRYEWKAVMNNDLPKINFQPEKAITISGTVKTKGGKPVIKGKVTLMNLSQEVFLLDTVTDKNGRFSFSMAFPDSTKFTIKTLNAKGNDNVLVEIDQAPGVTRLNKNAADFIVSVNKGLEGFIQNSKKQFEEDAKFGIGDHSIMLKEVNINQLNKSPRKIAEEAAVKYSSNLNGPGEADQVITADDLEFFGGSTIWDRLNGRLAGVEIKDIGSGMSAYSIRSADQMNSGPQPMQVLIDGVFGRDINSLPVETVESVEVLRRADLLAAYGSRAGNGLLIVTTKHGNQERIMHMDDYNLNIVGYTPKGFYKAKQFYSPKYAVSTTVGRGDFRSTIFWEPFVQTDKEGNTSVNFFNTDLKGTYRVVIEGIDYRTGAIGRQVLNYKVE